MTARGGREDRVRTRSTVRGAGTNPEGRERCRIVGARSIHRSNTRSATFDQRVVLDTGISDMRYPDKNCRLSMSSIVKNEAATLAQCLASIRDIVDDIVVVDTGSSDHSKDIALQHGARVFDLPWPDSFAAARNESIRHATGQWLLWLDADEYFDEANRDKLRRLVAELNDDNTAYVMQQRSAAGNGSATLVG